MASSDPSGPGKPPSGDPGTSKERSEAIVRQRALGRELRAIYSQIAEEPVPDTFLDLLNELERSEKKPGKEDNKEDGDE